MWFNDVIHTVLQAQGDDDDVAVGVEEKGGYMEEFFQEVIYGFIDV